MAIPTREDTYLVNVTVGNLWVGTFDTHSGGEVDSEESKYRPGGMDEEISLGGRQTIGNVTVGRYYDVLRDHAIYKWLCRQAGKTRGNVMWVPLTINGHQIGEVVQEQGTLKRVQRSDIDSMGGDAATLELEFTIDLVA